MNELEELMTRVQEEEAARHEFCEKFLSTQVFVVNAASSSGGEAERVLQEGAAIQILNAQFDNGETYIPVFTSAEELGRSIAKDMQVFGFNGAALLRMLGPTNILVNPVSMNSVFLPAQAVAEIMDHFFGDVETDD